jgi:hypothetical protein
MSQSFRVAWYRHRATFARQLTGYLTVVLLIGLIGGINMASVAVLDVPNLRIRRLWRTLILPT